MFCTSALYMEHGSCWWIQIEAALYSTWMCVSGYKFYVIRKKNPISEASGVFYVMYTYFICKQNVVHIKFI